MRQLYKMFQITIMFSKRDNYMRIKCFKTRQLYANKMFQNETIICE